MILANDRRSYYKGLRFRCILLLWASEEDQLRSAYAFDRDGKTVVDLLAPAASGQGQMDRAGVGGPAHELLYRLVLTGDLPVDVDKDGQRCDSRHRIRQRWFISWVLGIQKESLLQRHRRELGKLPCAGQESWTVIIQREEDFTVEVVRWCRPLSEAKLRLIDLDASAAIAVHSDQFAGAKYSSAYIPPELLFRSEKEKEKGRGKILVRTYEKAADEGAPSSNYSMSASWSTRCSPPLRCIFRYVVFRSGHVLHLLCTGGHATLLL